jgi:hypothetical protein
LKSETEILDAIRQLSFAAEKSTDFSVLQTLHGGIDVLKWAAGLCSDFEDVVTNCRKLNARAKTRKGGAG